MRALSVLMVSDVSPLSRGGGAERLLWEHARGLARRGHTVTVLGRAADGMPATTLMREGVRLVIERGLDLGALHTHEFALADAAAAFSVAENHPPTFIKSIIRL